MKNLYERFASSEDGAQLLAATRLRRETLRILHKALEASGLTQSQLAERLRIRKSAVNQVFRGDGNLRVNTLAQYLSAMGFELDIRAVEAGEPRKAVVEGREMTPAFKQDWVESESISSSSGAAYGDAIRHGFVHMATSVMPLRFNSNPLTAMVVEMRRDPESSAGDSLYDFQGQTAEMPLPEIASSHEFHPIRNEVVS
ncbi:helix-turn-helix domain-containing protein [Streptomyces violaceoruber]|uniref:Helix-turn-helix transcriptional regulator n=1 Tax=Streptomyces violaceoruber TaxID=1935 RepID=A0ACD4WP39_STRVN|nr:helix-turn-helix transcriptional regulator [Streptomyces violaceoruber]BDD73559.1 hypothetical protein JCM4020_41790 [Streptomyces coelicolor]